MATPDPWPEMVMPFLAEPARAAVLCDFDGTLSTIVDEPDDARPVPGAVEMLHRLAAVYGLVAVVSGRPAGFLVDHLAADGSTPLQAIGGYGLERAVAGEVEYHPEAERWRPAVAAATARAREHAPAGVLIEDKTVSLTIHLRTAPEHRGWAQAFVAAEAEATGLAIHEARMSYELRPSVPVDKGTTVAGLIGDLGPACFFGDDRGDLAAFDALDRHRAETGAPVLKIAVRSEEAPPELLARADVLLDSPVDVVISLDALAAARRAPGDV